jgi:hypothetical protein
LTLTFCRRLGAVTTRRGRAGAAAPSPADDDHPFLQLFNSAPSGEEGVEPVAQSRETNPDLIVIKTKGTLWVVEVKMDKEMASADVQGKREAAEEWGSPSGRVTGLSLCSGTGMAWARG